MLTSFWSYLILKIMIEGNSKNRRVGLMKMYRNKVIVLLFLIVAILLIMVGISYAYFTAVASSNDQVVEVGTLKLTYHTGQNISLDSIFPGEEIDAGIHTFAIENTGTMSATYYLYLDCFA